MNYRGMNLVVLLCAATIAACATVTEVKTVWKDDAYKAQPKRVLVLAMFRSKTLSMMVEDEFLINLKSRKIDAVASYDVFPGNELPTREMVVEQVRAGSYDAVLLTRFIDIRMEQRTVPGTAMAPHYGMPMGGYYDYGYTALYAPTYVVDEQHARIASDLYDAATERLVWSSLSATKLSEAEQTMIQAFVAAMMGSLRDEKIVP